MKEAALLLLAYLFGSFPMLYLLGRLRGFDLRQEEDMHIALWRKVGRLEGALGVAYDLAKGAVAVVVARALGFELTWVALAGLAVVVGQMWPIFQRFDGEKGNSTGLAMMLALAPEPLLLAIVPVLAGVAIRTLPRLLKRNQSVTERLKFGGPPSKSLPLGMLLGFALLPALTWALGEPKSVVFVALALSLFIYLRRLTDGVRADLRGASSKRSVLLNRFLFDRSSR